jgi:BTB/POZ domain-containing protein KCTD9
LALLAICWLNVNSFKGQILTNAQQYFELIKVCEFSPNDKWTLLYRGTRDGFGAKDFHSKCDCHSNTLTILKAKESEFIFGGYTTVTWESSAGFKFKSDPNAFIFSLTNKDNKPVKMNIDPDPNRHDFAIYCRSSCGPSFGGGVDLCIANNANTTMDSYSFLGRTYKHPQYEYGTNEAKSFLAGSYRFQLDEIEVYEKRE